MMSKRGTDHTWKLVKYKGDEAIYAKCQCKFRYRCSTDAIGEDGTRNPFRQVPTMFYLYCPICGARKKWYTDEVEKLDKYEFEYETMRQ